MKEQDDAFPREFPGFFDYISPFPFKRNFDFTPYDTIFSSWRTRIPDFHMLSEFPPIMHVPNVEVFCDVSELTLRVDKRLNGVILSAEEIQLGDGCYSNRVLPHQFVFVYRLDECGTAHVVSWPKSYLFPLHVFLTTFLRLDFLLQVQNGLETFTNTIYLNLKKPLPNWWQTPSPVHISCTPKRCIYWDIKALSGDK